MLRKLLVVLALFLCVHHADAQKKMRSVLKRKVAEASLYGNFGLYDGPYWGTGLSVHYMWGIGRNKQRFKVGLGLRNYFFSARNREYFTSDVARVASLRGGTDSIFFPKMQSIILDGYLAFLFHVKRGIDFGINIDVGGLTFGSTKIGYFHSYELTLTQKFRENVQPYGFNLNPLLFQDMSKGSTFNEAYFQFNANNILRIRAGVNYFVNEIETKTIITGNGTRFKNNNYMFMLGCAFNIRAQKTARDAFDFYKF
jgi:hypothetical protein